jgi:hypothetical protein
MDAGGPKREWLDLLCIKMFQNSSNGLFSSFSNSRLVHPNPASKRTSTFALKYYELAGLIVGKCLFETAIGLSYKQMGEADIILFFLLRRKEICQLLISVSCS